MLGWRRVPYIWIGTLLQFGGLAIMPFALIVLSGDTHGPAWCGQVGAALAFLLVGAGLHTAQTAGLALATDLAPPRARPRVVALLYVMLLVGMVVERARASARCCADFSQMRLIQVIQGAARADDGAERASRCGSRRRATRAHRAPAAPRPSFGEAWRALRRPGAGRRLLVAVGLGTAAFTMQDVLLEPYGGEILRPVGRRDHRADALLAGGALVRLRPRRARCSAAARDPHRLAGFGALRRRRRLRRRDLRRAASSRRCCSASARC